MPGRRSPAQHCPSPPVDPAPRSRLAGAPPAHVQARHACLPIAWQLRCTGIARAHLALQLYDDAVLPLPAPPCCLAVSLSPTAQGSRVGVLLRLDSAEAQPACANHLLFFRSRSSPAAPRRFVVLPCFCCLGSSSLVVSAAAGMLVLAWAAAAAAVVAPRRARVRACARPRRGAGPPALLPHHPPPPATHLHVPAYAAASARARTCPPPRGPGRAQHMPQARCRLRPVAPVAQAAHLAAGAGAGASEEPSSRCAR